MDIRCSLEFQIIRKTMHVWGAKEPVFRYKTRHQGFEPTTEENKHAPRIFQDDANFTDNSRTRYIENYYYFSPHACRSVYENTPGRWQIKICRCRRFQCSSDILHIIYS